LPESVAMRMFTCELLSPPGEGWLHFTLFNLKTSTARVFT